MDHDTDPKENEESTAEEASTGRPPAPMRSCRSFSRSRRPMSSAPSRTRSWPPSAFLVSRSNPTRAETPQERGASGSALMVAQHRHGMAQLPHGLDPELAASSATST